jgi:hypothetical protein
MQILKLTRPFTSSAVLLRDRYLINGSEMTRDQILGIRPIERSVAHWRVLVDWDMWKTHQFIVVDPYSPTSLLYLSQADYLSLGRICVSNDLSLIVIATPSTKKLEPVGQTSSQNSPLPVGFEPKWTKQSRVSWKTFLDFRAKVRGAVPLIKDSTMVSETKDSIVRTVLVWARELLHYTEVKNSGMIPELLTPVARHLSSLIRHNGQGGAIKHLKVCLFLLYSYLSGNPLKCTTPLGWGIRLTNGLPSYWPEQLRSFIRSGNLPMIRVMASILNLYRAMDAKHPQFSTATITQPHPDFRENQTFIKFEQFASEIFPKLLATQFEDGSLPSFEYESGQGMLIRTAGANVSGPSSASTVLDAHAWKAAPQNYVRDWFVMHRDASLRRLLDAHSKELVLWFTPRAQNPEGGYGYFDKEGVLYAGPTLPDSGGMTFNGFHMANRCPRAVQLLERPILSRLHTIDEPAGKVRVVAICDYWTQVALKPVHEFLFSVLKGLASNDATFDQDGVTNDYFQRDLKPHWSFDLKAATDSIPLALYKSVLTPILKTSNEDLTKSKERVELWAKILTDRDFYLPLSKEEAKTISDLGTLPPTVRYNTGQPMGALSSWASMALVHHALIQFSNWKALGFPSGDSMTWYTDYLILGDDVDIASSSAVSTAYVEICKDFSIVIGLEKTIKSNMNFFEFANRRYAPQGDISPLSFREELACSTWNQRLEFAKRILRRLGKPLTEVSSLIRRVTTSSQWTVLRPELSGRRSLSMTRLVRYCLLNPFAVKDREGFSISSLLDWITNVIPDSDIPKIREVKVDSVRLEHLQRALTEHVRKSVFAALSSMIKGKCASMWAPSSINDDLKVKFEHSMGPPIGTNASEARYLEGQLASLPRLPQIKELNKLIMAEQDSFDERILAARKDGVSVFLSPPGGQVSWAYYLTCTNSANEKILTKIFALWDEADNMSKRLPVFNPLAYKSPGVYNHKQNPKVLGQWIDLWVSILQIPKPIQCDLNYSVHYNLDYNSARETLAEKLRKPGEVVIKNPESLYGPMLELATVVAEHLGIRIPNIPFFSFAKKGKHWAKSLIRSLEVFQRQQAIDKQIMLSFQYGKKLHARPLDGSFAAWWNIGVLRDGELVTPTETL